MGEVIRRSTISWTVIASVCLHAGVAVLLLLRMSDADQVTPVGIEMIYLGDAAASKSTVPPAIAKAVKEIAKIRQAQKIPAEISPEAAALKAEPAEATATTATPASGANGPAGRRDGSVVTAIERYKFELRLFLESRKIYPETAKRLRQTGKVVVHFKVSPQGQLSDVSLEAPSPSEILNRAAIDLVNGAQRFKPIPSDANLTELQLSLPIEYIL